MNADSRRRLVRAAFWLYAAAILALTHWPGLALPQTGLDRTDLYVHLLVFGAWTTLLNLTGFLGPVLAPRAIVRRALVAAAYVCFDEGTQALPLVNRDARWDDLGANLAGVALASVALALASLRRRPRPRA